MTINQDWEINPQLTALAIAYKNAEFIADTISPYTPVMSDPFKYTQFTTADSYRQEDDAIGRTGLANETDESSFLVTAGCTDHGLDRIIPRRDSMQSYPKGFDPQARAVEMLGQKVLLNREVRIAAQITTLANYDSDKRTTLTGTDQFSDYTNSDPVNKILRAIDLPLERPTHGVMSQDGFSFLRGHPKIINAIKGQVGLVNGVATKEAIADLFGLKGILVGGARVNTANKGQTPSYVRVWGKDLALIAVNPLANLIGGGATFALTGRFGDRIVRTMDEPKLGLWGSARIRFGESVSELIVAQSAGYLFKAAFA